MPDDIAKIYQDVQLLMQNVYAQLSDLNRAVAKVNEKIDGVTMSMVTRAECTERHRTLDVRCIEKHINVVDRREFRAGVSIILFLVALVGGAVAAYVKLFPPNI